MGKEQKTAAEKYEGEAYRKSEGSYDDYGYDHNDLIKAFEAGYKSRLSELEAENKALREALHEIIDFCPKDPEERAAGRLDIAEQALRGGHND